MLTPEQKEEIKKLLIREMPLIKVATETLHSPQTVRKVRSEMREELKQSQTQVQANGPEDFAIIPLEVGFLAELMVEKAIDPGSEVHVPVSREVAEEFYKIEGAFRKLEPVLDELAKTIGDAITLERRLLEFLAHHPKQWFTVGELAEELASEEAVSESINQIQERIMAMKEAGCVRARQTDGGLFFQAVLAGKG